MEERNNIEQAIQGLELQRPALGDAAVDLAIASLRRQSLSTQAVAASVSELVGERKLVTIMFADLSGFTTMSEKLDPEQVRTLMNSWFNTLVPFVEKYEGTVEQFIGDEIMALFGAPNAHEQDPENCLRGALEMMEALKGFNERHRCSLGMHIGINTGTVVTGGMGSEGRQQYSVLGDAVNLAARLEDASENGQILLGQNTYRLTSAAFDFKPLPPIPIKGKSGLVPIYQLLGVKSGANQRHGVTGLHSPLVGRSAEFEILSCAVQRLLHDHRGSLGSVAGEPGIGKSRLVAEVRQASCSDILWVEGRAQSYTAGMTYWMAQTMLDGLLGIAVDAAPSEVAQALRSSLEDLFPDPGQFEQVFPYLAQLRGVPLEPSYAERLQHVLPEAIQNRTRAAFANVIRILCGQRPMVLVWEDVHWADPSSLGLLESLVPLVDELPLMILCVFRPQEGNAQDWFTRIAAGRPSAPLRVELAPLAESDCQLLVQNLLRIENLLLETRHLILEKAEGNPFFLEEILRSLLETGLVLVDGGRAVATHAIHQLDVPDTLQGVIAARIDRLPPHEKYTLQTASVIGRIFQRPVLAYLLQREHSHSSLDLCLEDLQQRELIRHRVELEYIFKHAVTQDVTYNSLLLAKRKELHRVAAQAIESLFPDQLDELAPTLAYHYQRTASPEQAVHFSILAAERARKSYANGEAIAFYRSALEQAQECHELHSDLPGLHEKLGDILTLIGKQDEARLEYQAALSCASTSHGIMPSRLRRKDGNTWMSEREYAKSLHACDLAEAALAPVAEDAGQEWHREWIEIQLDRVWAHYWGGQVSEMVALMDRMRRDMDLWGTPLQRARFYKSLVMVGWRQDRFVATDQTLAHARQAADAAEACGDRHEIAFETTMLGMCHLWRFDLDEAEAHLRKALDVAEQIGDAESQLLSLTYLTVTYRRKRDAKRTRYYARQSEELARLVKMNMYVGVARANMAWTYWANGDLNAARRDAETALETWKTTAYPGTWLALWLLIGIALEQGREEDAFAYSHALLGFSPMKMPDVLEEALGSAVQAWDAGGRERAGASLKIAVAMADQSGWL